MRVHLDHNPLAPRYEPPQDFAAGYQARPAWISLPSPNATPEVTAYRLRFSLAEVETLRVHVSADERYQLFVDGLRAGWGPERGSDRAWFYETYDLPLDAGEHVFVAIVWRLGPIGPLAQVGLVGGFLLEAEPPHAGLVSTRAAAWEAKRLGGLTFSLPMLPTNGAWFVEPVQTTDGAAYPWGVETGDGEGWEKTMARREDFTALFGIQAPHCLVPALLPGQISAVRRAGAVRYAAPGDWTDPGIVFVTPGKNRAAEAQAWQAMLDGRAPVSVPPFSRRQVVLDLEQYCCAYPQITLSGGRGATLTAGWAEALHLDPQGWDKGQRDGVEGRSFIALCRDHFLPDGGAQRHFETLWWRAGRYVLLLVETAGEALTVESILLEETRYPLEMESRFTCSDPRLGSVIPVALRSLQMCAHETYMDCPYYEQMMYVGDTRLEALTTYALCSDDRLPRKAITLFNLSRLPDGMVQARYPGRDVQVIPPFALGWVGLLSDFALWRDDRAFVARMLPGMRAVLDGFLALLNPDGLLSAPDGWNFSDWIATWPLGVPPDAFEGGASGLLNWHLVYTLGLAARLEGWFGDAQLARRFELKQKTLAAQAAAAFWDEGRGLFADNQAHTLFSEHTQCLALLSGALEDRQIERTGQNLVSDPNLTRTTIYFTHYLFETYYRLGQGAPTFDRLKLWFDLSAQGFKTTPESPEPTRSDCHGWGAHVLYHYFASVSGIRPAAFGFRRVEIAPMLGPLRALSASMVHPRGKIELDLKLQAGRLIGAVSLPEGLEGSFRFAGNAIDLVPGPQAIDLPTGEPV